jgi:hypothetical protein
MVAMRKDFILKAQESRVRYKLEMLEEIEIA